MDTSVPKAKKRTDRNCWHLHTTFHQVTKGSRVKDPERPGPAVSLKKVMKKRVSRALSPVPESSQRGLRSVASGGTLMGTPE